MFAQAMSSTMPVMPSRSSIGVRASVCTLLCPRCPSTSSIALARKRAIVGALMPSWSGASTSLMMGLYTPLIAFSAWASVTPGLSRPNTYSQ